VARKRHTYSERIARGLARGLTRSQARGHARLGEPPLRPARPMAVLPEREAEALRVFRTTGNATKAAKSAGISPERFRRFIRAELVAERRGHKWAITDNLVRETDIISGGRRYAVRVRGFDPASRIAQHKAAVRQFLALPEEFLLDPFRGEAVTDIAGRKHVFETNPNTLFRLMTTGGETFEAVYRIVV
jgi:hypothetical protein